jgi:hypothetical protein
VFDRLLAGGSLSRPPPFALFMNIWLSIILALVGGGLSAQSVDTLLLPSEKFGRIIFTPTSFKTLRFRRTRTSGCLYLPERTTQKAIPNRSSRCIRLSNTRSKRSTLKAGMTLTIGMPSGKTYCLFYSAKCCSCQLNTI